MFGIGMPELILIGLVALIVVGPKKLPELAKTLGKGLSEFRKTASDVTDGFKDTIKADEIKEDLESMKSSLLHGKGEEEEPKSTTPVPPSEEAKNATPSTSKSDTQ